MSEPVTERRIVVATAGPRFVPVMIELDPSGKWTVVSVFEHSQETFVAALIEAAVWADDEEVILVRENVHQVDLPI